MIQRPSTVCLLCELRTSILSQNRPCGFPSWPLYRPYATARLQKKSPDRMILSRDVAKPPLSDIERLPRKRKVDGPFAAMNRTDPGIRVVAERKRREAGFNWHAQKATEKGGKSKKNDRKPGDMKALKMQSALSSVSYNQRSSIKSKISARESFDDFSLLPAVQDSIYSDVLKGMTVVTPTPVQRLAIPSLLGKEKGRGRRWETDSSGMKQFLLAAETGSGKTLAYLAPTIDSIKRAEIREAEAEARDKAAEQEKKSPRQSMYELESPPLSSEPHPTMGRPRAIILVPTSELVEQVGILAKQFSHKVKLRVGIISASYSATVIRNRLFSPNGIDVVVSTPHLLGSIAQSDPNILSRVSHLIVDEADSLFDRSFAPLTSAIIDRSTPSLQQLILCSATIPRSLDSYLMKRFPAIERLATPNLHAIPRRVQLSVVDIDRDPYRGNRDLACADSIWAIGRDTADIGASSDDGIGDKEALSPAERKIKRILVFVNERSTAISLASYLVSKGIDAAPMNRDTPEQRSGAVLSAFTSPTSDATVSKPDAGIESEDAITTPTKRTLLNTKVLVMTDIGSRGIDTINVRHVILYDVPHTSIDFIHRLGRTGRMGRRGKGIVLVGKHDRKDVVKDVREGMFRGQALI